MKLEQILKRLVAALVIGTTMFAPIGAWARSRTVTRGVDGEWSPEDSSYTSYQIRGFKSLSPDGHPGIMLEWSLYFRRVGRIPGKGVGSITQGYTWTGFRVYRDGEKIATVNDTRWPFHYRDTEVVAGESHIYQVEAVVERPAYSPAITALCYMSYDFRTEKNDFHVGKKGTRDTVIACVQKKEITNVAGDDMEINASFPKVNWTATSDSDWLKLSDANTRGVASYSNSETSVLFFACAPNMANEARTATLSISATVDSEKIQKKITVVQDAGPAEFDINFDACGGTGDTSTIMRKYGEELGELPVVTLDGYVFTGWFTAAEGGEAVTAEMVVTDDVTYYAHWTPNQYTLTFNAAGGTDVVPITQDYGTTVTPPDQPTRIGYTFLGWNPEVPEKMPAEDMMLCAQWIANAYTVRFDANGGEGGWSREMEYGAAIVVPTVARTGHTFLGWDGEVAATVPASNVTYKAQWAVNWYPVTLDLGDGMGDADLTLNYGTLVGDIQTPTRSGYDFDGWWTDAEGGVRVSDNTTVTGSMSLYAHWTMVRPQLWHELTGAVNVVAASTYDGYLYDANGNVKGTIQVKVGKPNKKTGLASVKATVIGLDGKKVQLVAADKGKALIATDGPMAVAFVGGEACEIVLGAGGMTGTYGNAAVDGALNVFASKDAADKAVATDVLGKWQGAVNVAWREDATGWNGLSVILAAKGKAKVNGTLADGTKVSAKGQLLVGDEWCCVPVVVSKKAQVAFNVWLPLNMNGQDARSPSVNGQDVRSPSVVGLGDAIVGKPGTLKGGATFRLGTAMGDAKYNAYLPDVLVVKQAGRKWALPKAGKVQLAKDGAVDASKLGENPSALKLTYKAKDGTFKGSFKAYADANGKPKATTVNVAGVLVNGTGYGTATAKDANAPVTIE